MMAAPEIIAGKIRRAQGLLADALAELGPASGAPRDAKDHAKSSAPSTAWTNAFHPSPAQGKLVDRLASHLSPAEKDEIALDAARRFKMTRFVSGWDSMNGKTASLVIDMLKQQQPERSSEEDVPF